MRSQAILLAALAALVSVPAAAQPAAAPSEPAAHATGSDNAPDTDTDTGHKDGDDGAAPSTGQAKQEEAAEKATDNSDDENGDETPEAGSAPPLVPSAVDTLSGHLSLAGSAGVAVPFGEVQQNMAQSKVMGTGWGFGAELGYGASRSVVIGAWGQALRLGGGSACSTCSTTSFALGPFVRYHLVQGTRFDPWMSAGLGFRTTKITGAAGGDLSYSGLEWLRLRVGGDWYAFSRFGFGPYLELDAGHYLSRPAQASGSAAAHMDFQAGLRVIIDLPGK